MSSAPLVSLFEAVCFAIIASAGAALLVWLAFVRPRLGLYALFALAPTQFIFLPAGNFFLSPADVLATACGAGLVLRALSGQPQTRRAVCMHVMLGFMVAAYVAGFVVLGHFSRTLVRVPLAIVPSILACELLERPEHLRFAIRALICAALLDAAYGLVFAAAGHPLHPARFSGMMGVNFSAIILAAGAAMAFARVAQSRDPLNLLLPLLLATLAAATLSRTALAALLIAGGVVLWKIASPVNRRLVLVGAVAALVFIVGTTGLRERLIARNDAVREQDGAWRTSQDVRKLIFDTASHAFTNEPVFGIGYSNFQAYSTRDPDIQRSTKSLGYATHNSYLEIAVEGGLLALVPFLLHFGTYAPGLKRAWAVMARDRGGVIGAAVSALLVAVITAAGANVLLHYVFWSIAGLALACCDRITPLIGAMGAPAPRGGAPVMGHIAQRTA